MFLECTWISSDLFPSKWSVVIFISYMALFINQGILVTATKGKDNSYNYNPTTVVLFTECIKLLLSSFLYLKEFTFKQMLVEVIKYSKVFLLYFIPAFLYCLYNNLAFVNLAVFDPTTYYLLLQFRVVVTGIIFQVLFKKNLSQKQWISLCLLTVGCIVKQIKLNPDSSGPSQNSIFNINIILILLQVFCSCFAGVYNEYLLKGVGVDTHIMMQNIFMYVDSIICNLILLTFNGKLLTAFTSDAISSVMSIKVICIMFNNAGIGLVTSFFLKNLNSILKTFASALELMFTAVLCWLIFDIRIDIFTVIAIVIVSYATFLYSQNPVVNIPKSEANENFSNEKVSANNHKISTNV